MRAGRLEVAVSAQRHAGLYLDKFLPQEEGKEKNALQEDLRQIANADLASRPYELALRRWRSQWEGRESVVCATGTVRGRLATGLGAASVMENGLRMHFTYGTPVIPGSTLKGVLRKALPPEHKNNQRQDGRNVEWYLFGDPDHEGAARIEDAWWIPGAGKALALDVLTPHHQAYMQKQGPPTEFDEPVPVQFLTAGSRQKFLFVLAAPTVAWKRYLHGLLKDALRREGVGAKRSAGYGIVDLS